MNIFEALEKGENWKATLLEHSNYAFKDWYGIFKWVSGIEVTYADLKRNDWLPYVPRETSSVCGNCQLPSPGKSIVKVTPTGNCVCCDRQIIPPTKTKIKHKEVFEDVIWIQESFSGVVYSYCFTKPLAFKPFQLRGHTKVTIEWEE